MNTFYRYVTRSCIAAYEEMGWFDMGPSGGHHGAYSHTMVINGDFDEPPEPQGNLKYQPAASVSDDF